MVCAVYEFVLPRAGLAVGYSGHGLRCILAGLAMVWAGLPIGCAGSGLSDHGKVLLCVSIAMDWFGHWLCRPLTG